MTKFAERITHYETKCREHLNRVRLSHVLALRALSGEQVQSDRNVAELIRASFEGGMEGRYDDTKMRTVFHKLHLVSLKANFELFLNRLLSIVWKFHFPGLPTKISNKSSKDILKISLQELAEAFAHTDSSIDVEEFIIDKVVPVHDLEELEDALEWATCIRLRDVLNRKDKHCWPQIYTAFEVRHLVEHRDGRVDRKFQENVARVWVQSSWGGGGTTLERGDKVRVEEEDVNKTCEAMLKATGLLAEAVLRWSLSRQAGVEVGSTEGLD